MPTPSTRLAPVEIAPDTFVIQHTVGGGPAPVVHLNSMVIRAAEPVIVDTGAPIHRDDALEDILSLVDPEDVRWIWISHDDIDHYGNVEVLLDKCPNATMVANWFLCERLSGEGFPVPPTRWRWVDDGDRLDVGDRSLVAVRPPLYDSPTTRGLLDPTTGVYWASDCFAAPVSGPTAFAEEVDPDAYAGGFMTMNKWGSPWVDMVDPVRFSSQVRQLAAMGVETIASCHGPSIRGPQVARAFELLEAIPTADVPPQPGQPVLDEIVASLAALQAPAA